MYPYFDLHCDTLSAAFDKCTNLYDSALYASLNKIKHIEPYVQVASVWSDCLLSDDECYLKALKVISYAQNQNIEIITRLNSKSSASYLLGIEDARLLNNDISRLDILYLLGIRVLTLNWKDISCIGGGWNTSAGLTDFGKEVVRRCAELKIIVDLSHCSEKVFYEVIDSSKRLNLSIIASHSNACSLHNHKRNLTDEQIKALIKQGSLIGISLVGEHLGLFPTSDTVISHMEHILSLGGESSLCLGCDLDGTDNLPSDIRSIEDASLLYEKALRYFGDKITKKIFFDNGFSYFSKILS